MKKKMGGVCKKNPKNLRYEKKNLIETEKFCLKNQFFANFQNKFYFFYVKFAFRMFSAFIDVHIVHVDQKS